MLSRQLAIPYLHPQEDDWLEFGQNLLTFPQVFSPRLLLFVQPLQAMLLDFGQANAVQCSSPNLEGVAPFLLLPLQSLLIPGMEFMEGVFAVAFRV